MLFNLAHKLDANLRNSLYISVASSVINVDGALFVADYDIYTAYAVKQLGLAAGLANAMMPARQKGPKTQTFAQRVHVPKAPAVP